MTTLYVDADACPVRDEAARVAERHGVAVKVVSNGGIRPDPRPFVQTVIVADGPDAADDWIAERIGPGDLCVTADIPLASRCVAAGALALTPDGRRLDAASVGPAKAMRDLMTDLRAADPLGRGGGPRPFDKAARSRFLDMLDRELRVLRRTR